jgi:hypothetical protein
MTVRVLLKGGSLRRRGLMRIGMRDRTHLGNEQRQRNNGCDAKFLAMGPIEQGQPFG